MEAKAKERLHRLVDQIPEAEVHTAERFLEYLAAADDAVLRALMSAPDDEEALTDADRQALEEGRRAISEDDIVSDEELGAELGI